MQGGGLPCSNNSVILAWAPLLSLHTRYMLQHSPPWPLLCAQPWVQPASRPAGPQVNHCNQTVWRLADTLLGEPLTPPAWGAQGYTATAFHRHPPVAIIVSRTNIRRLLYFISYENPRKLKKKGRKKPKQRLTVGVRVNNCASLRKNIYISSRFVDQADKFTT